jgi:hypothetical protein
VGSFFGQRLQAADDWTLVFHLSTTIFTRFPSPS